MNKIELNTDEKYVMELRKMVRSLSETGIASIEASEKYKAFGDAEYGENSLNADKKFRTLYKKAMALLNKKATK